MKYSNCLFEAIKAKIKDPKNIHIFLLPPKLNNGRYHFYWIDDNQPNIIKSFINPKATSKQSFLFKDGEFDKHKRDVFENFTIQRLYRQTNSLEEMLKLAKKFRFQMNETEIKNLFDNLEWEGRYLE